MTSQTQITGVDLAALEAWMDIEGLGEGEIEDAMPIGGGTQNVMVRFTRDGREYVLRRGPEHLRPGSNQVISREFEVLRALRGTDVPHAELIAACDDISVLGDAVFYLMEPIEGFNAGLELPDEAAGTDVELAIDLTQRGEVQRGLASCARVAAVVAHLRMSVGSRKSALWTRA